MLDAQTSQEGSLLVAAGSGDDLGSGSVTEVKRGEPDTTGSRMNEDTLSAADSSDLI
jgi:hypothetical protein